jgi:hypothetical protein
MGTNENNPYAETVADILREMREAAKSTDLFNGEEVGEPLIRGTKVEDWADRIEAAEKREKAATEADALNVGGIVEAMRHKSGDSDAMREALEQVLKDLWDLMGTSSESAQSNMACEMSRKIRAALSAPARNCDRFATRSDAWDAFAATYFGPTDPGEMEYYFGVWLFAKAIEKGETDGSK